MRFHAFWACELFGLAWICTVRVTISTCRYRTGPETNNVTHLIFLSKTDLRTYLHKKADLGLAESWVFPDLAHLFSSDMSRSEPPHTNGRTYFVHQVSYLLERKEKRIATRNVRNRYQICKLSATIREVDGTAATSLEMKELKALVWNTGLERIGTGFKLDQNEEDEEVGLEPERSWFQFWFRRGSSVSWMVVVR